MHELSMDLNAVLRHAVEACASDVHLKVGPPPVFRSDGELAPAADFGPLGDAELRAVSIGR
jgi:Tfp pilus assembly pilus retraction ATPase PilT